MSQLTKIILVLTVVLGLFACEKDEVNIDETTTTETSKSKLNQKKTVEFIVVDTIDFQIDDLQDLIDANNLLNEGEFISTYFDEDQVVWNVIVSTTGPLPVSTEKNYSCFYTNIAEETDCAAGYAGAYNHNLANGICMDHGIKDGGEYWICERPCVGNAY